MLTKTDLQQIKLLLTGTVSPIKKSLDRVEKRVEATEKGVKVLDKRMGTMEGKMGTMEGKMGTMEGKMGTMEGKMGTMEGKMGTMEDTVKGQNSRIDRISGVVGQLVEKVQDMDETLIGIKDKINLLPTKDEYFNSMDKLMKEVKDSRETQEISGNRLSNHSDQLENHEVRISKLEKVAIVS